MTGHEQLLKDLEDLLAEARAFQFHDFKNTRYATPKVALAQRLHELRQAVINGKYDNAP